MRHDAKEHLIHDSRADPSIEEGQVANDDMPEEAVSQCIGLVEELACVSRLFLGGIENILVLEDSSSQKSDRDPGKCLLRIVVQCALDLVAEPSRLRDAAVEEGR